MKARTFKIRSKHDIKLVSDFLESQPEKPLLECVIRPHQKKRSLEQNSLYHMWVTIIADELGETKEDVHFDLRKRMLLPIYERDNQSYAEMLNSVRKVHQLGAKDVAKIQANFIINETSTTDATVKQFTEFLKEIERDSISKGIVLPHPEDRYNLAMGIKQPKQD